MEAKTRASPRIQSTPVVQRLLQQGEGSNHISLDERCRAVDRAIDMAFGREIHHELWLVAFEQPAQRGSVANVHLRKQIAPASRGRLRNRIEV